MKSILFLLASLPTLLIAQGERSSKEPLLRFAYVGVSENKLEYVLSVGMNRSKPFVIPNNEFSVPVSPPRGADPLMVGKENEDAFQGLATITIPDAGDRFLVLLFPEEKNTLRAVVIRADDPTFLPGHIMIFNIANQPLTAELGEEKFTFTPDSQTLFRPTKKGDLANYQIRFYQEKEGKTKLFAASLWPYFDDKRVFVILYMDATSGSPRYRSIDEFTSWTKPDAEAVEATP